MFNKVLNNAEREIYKYLSDLNLTGITMPHIIRENTLWAATGTHVSRENIDIVKLYNDCLSKLYVYRNMNYSKGIYSFWRGEKLVCNKVISFFEYIKQELTSLIEQLEENLNSNLNIVYNKCKKKAMDALDKYIISQYSIKQFELLHGDLHSGNILYYEGEYKLIDFELMRFGMKEFDFAFFLCWDFLYDSELAMKAKQIINLDIENMLKNNIIDNNSEVMIRELLIPMYIVIACLYISSGCYKGGDDFLYGINVFYDNYFID